MVGGRRKIVFWFDKSVRSTMNRSTVGFLVPDFGYRTDEYLQYGDVGSGSYIGILDKIEIFLFKIKITTKIKYAYNVIRFKMK